MFNMHQIDYSTVLSDLKSKRTQLDKAIVNIENLINIGLIPSSDVATTNRVPNSIANIPSKKIDVANLGVYEGAIYLLEEKGNTMRTEDIVEKIISSGKQFTSTNPKQSISTTLYKSIEDKKDCRLTRVGESEWGLVDWYSEKSNVA